MFRGGCTADGISAGSGPLSQFLQHATGPSAEQARFRLAQRDGQDLDHAWHAPMGAAMGTQLSDHMRQPFAAGKEPGFFEPLQRDQGGAWAQEFNCARDMHAAPQARGVPLAAQPRPLIASQPMQQQLPPAGPFLAPAFHGPPQLFGIQPAPAAFHMPATAPAAPEAQALHTEDVLEKNDDDLLKTKEMVEMFRRSGNAKFASSQFVDFADKVSKGELSFKDEAVVDSAGDVVDWDALYNVGPDPGAAAKQATQAQALDMLPAMQQPALIPDGCAEPEWLFWEGPSDLNMQSHLQSFEHEGGSSSSSSQAYQFIPENHYLTADHPLSMALDLLKQGHDRAARLALEAEVQKHDQSSEGWHRLGALHAETDDQVSAMQCLQRCVEVDPYNLDGILALGICCINDYDQVPALRCMRTWMERHEDYQQLVEGVPPPTPFDIRGWRSHVAELARSAIESHPNDADVLTILGLAELTRNDTAGAVRAFASACRHRPADHTAWNRLGTALAMAGSSLQACTAFQQALQLRPTYVRCWSNLAAAQARLGNFAEATRLHLSALVLNPRSTDSWKAAWNTATELDSADSLIDAIDSQDLEACARLVDGVLDVSTLPARAAQLSQPADEVLASLGL